MQLLISVKNAEEALLALQTGVDLIDLKDPDIGALGALSVAESEKIVRAINGRAVISATVGESHESLIMLENDIVNRAALGVNIIKIAVSKFCDEADFYSKTQQLSAKGIKLIAVFFADDGLDFDLLSKLDLLPKLRYAGFYGAMLDTKNKAKSLTLLADNNYLQNFAQASLQNHLEFGLAGSLKPQDIDFLSNLKPTFIGFRGGVCDNFVRQSSLSQNKMLEVKNMLLKHNKFGTKAQKSMNLALHS